MPFISRQNIQPLPASVATSWSASLTAESLNAEMGSQSVSVGVAPTATRQFDLGLDLEALPLWPTPSTVELDLHLSRAYATVNRLSQERLQPASQLEFILSIRADQSGFSLNWDLAQVPDYYQRVTLIDTVTGSHQLWVTECHDAIELLTVRSERIAFSGRLDT